MKRIQAKRDVIKPMPSCGVCRVTGCTQHGLLFKRLDKHLKRVHPGITVEMNMLLPEANVKERNIRQKSFTDRHIRRPCRVPSCRYYNVPMARLSDHLQRKHQLSLEKHAQRYPQTTSSKDTSRTVHLEDFAYTLPGACCDWEDDHIENISYHNGFLKATKNFARMQTTTNVNFC